MCVPAVRNKPCLTLSTRPLTKLNGGMSQLHFADDEAIACLTNYGFWSIWKKKKNFNLCIVVL